jgi:transcriptional regulator with XRE-family HTH domain
MLSQEIRLKMGAKVLALRKKNGLRQEDVGAVLGLNRVSIVNIESGRQQLTLEGMLKMCALFKCTPAQLLPPIPKLNIKDRPLPKPRRRIAGAKFKWT